MRILPWRWLSFLLAMLLLCNAWIMSAAMAASSVPASFPDARTGAEAGQMLHHHGDAHTEASPETHQAALHGTHTPCNDCLVCHALLPITVATQATLWQQSVPPASAAQALPYIQVPLLRPPSGTHA